MTRGERVIAFIERYCVVPEGKLVGKPLRLEPFQREFILAVYDNPAGTTEGILSIARKNGKSGLIAAILLAHIAGPEARLNSQIVSGARSRDQAALVFNLASKMVLLSPDLGGGGDPRRALVRIVPSGKRLIGVAMNVEFRALAADGHTAHGLSPVLAILDELGQVRGPQDGFVEAIETASGAYDDALRLIISTQAPTDADMLSVKIDDATRSADPKIVCRVYAAPADCDVMDTKAHVAANPALGTFRSSSELLAAAEKAKRMPSFENGFRNLYLNQRVNRFSPFIAPATWAACRGEPDLDAFKRFPVFGGLDLSETTDLTAFVLVCRDDAGLLHVLPTFWSPEATLVDRSKRDRAPYDTWTRDGLMLTAPGVALDYDFVATDIMRITAGMDVRKINFDRYRMKLLQPALDRLEADLPFEEFGQGFVSMTPALTAAEIEFLQVKVRHGGHPVLTMCAANAVVKPDPAGNRKLDKSKSTGRIDGMVALVMAIEASVGAEEGAPSMDDYLASGAMFA